jgi:regulator of sirC expression with transglutaminase-like and TPR domain
LINESLIIEVKELKSYMNELLISELHSENKSLLQKIILIEEFVFTSTNTCLDSVDSFVEHCQQALTSLNDERNDKNNDEKNSGKDEDQDNEFDLLAQAEQLINELYIGQILLDRYPTFWPIRSFQVQNSLDSRLISPTLKAIVLRYVIEACGFDCDIVYVPEKTMLRLICDDLYAIIFDPVTGESLNWQEFDVRMDDLDDPNEYQPNAMTHQQLIIQHLTSLKNALIREKEFDQALRCVDILLALRPDDPLQRRDRGFLLQQLDCFKVAVDDYRYFVEQCPKDPAAQLLKLQLENITLSETTLH